MNKTLLNKQFLSKTVALSGWFVATFNKNHISPVTMMCHGEQEVPLNMYWLVHIRDDSSKARSWWSEPWGGGEQAL